MAQSDFPGTASSTSRRSWRAAVEDELQLRVYSVFAAYLANDEANRDSFTADGWFTIGNLAMDGAGNVAMTRKIAKRLAGAAARAAS